MRNHARTFFSKDLLAFLAFAATLSFGPTAQATTADISGAYAGTLSGSESCTPPATSGPLSENMTLSITQSGTSFSGSGTSVDEDGETASFTFSGTVSGNTFSGSGSGTDSDGDPFTISSISGTASDGSLDVNISGFDSECSFSLSGILTRTSADLVLNPETTPSSTITTAAFLTQEVKALTTGLSGHVGAAVRGALGGPQVTAKGFGYSTGLAAGDNGIGYGAWASYSYSDFDNDLSSTAFDGNRHTVLAGLDLSPWERTVFGLALGYEAGDIDTTFNGGNQETDGYTIAPYVGALLTDTWSVDFSFGYSNVEYDQFRTFAGTRITSSPDADRWFGALNVNGLTTYGNWILGAKVGTLYAQSTIDSFVESDGTPVGELQSEVGQWNVGGNVAYTFGQFEPFANVTYENDFNMTEIAVTTGPQPANDDDDVLTGLGVRYYGQNGISGNVEWNKRLGREDFDEDIFTLSVRVDF